MLTSMQSRGPDPAKLQQRLFAKLDGNGDNAIDKTELKSFLDYVSSKTGGESVDSDALLKTIDTDGSGSISSDELSENGKALFDQLRDQLMSAQLSSSSAAPPPPPGSPPGDPEEMFASIDSNGDGSIAKSELETFLADRSQGDGPTVDDIFARDDADEDGSISTDEFTAAVSRRPPPPEQGNKTGGVGDIGAMIASLIEQYTAAGSTASETSTTQLSVVA
jgi:Ca2+-binding EF-hand superfamily protein